MRNFLIFLFALFFLSGCIEIVETIHVNKDTSGQVEYRVMTSQTNSWLGNFTGLVNNSIEEQLRSEAAKMVNVLKQQKGISNVEYKLGKLSGDFFIRFDFAGSDDFNNALYRMAGAKKTCFSPGYLKIKNHRVKKRNFTPWLKQYLKKEDIEIKQSIISDMLIFSSIIELPSDVRKVKPANLSVSEEMRKVIQRLSFTEILDENKSTGIRLKY